MKYIRHKTLGIMIFPEIIEHKSFIIKIFGAVNDSIISAGFVRGQKNHEQRRQEIYCYGRSVTLGLLSRDEDSGILLKQLNYY